MFNGKTTIKARALFLGERLNLRAFEATHRLGSNPLAVSAGQYGCAVLFRYGVIVLFDLTAVEEAEFRRSIESYVFEPNEKPEFEELDIRTAPNASEGFENGVLQLRESNIERMQVVAEILARSVVLAEYEARVARAFDRVEPLAAGLKTGHGSRHQGRELLKHIGDTLLIQHKMVGRVAVQEKPEILWEHAELERFHARLEDEYELQERHLALERKLDLITRTAETLLDVLQTNRGLRVEWYIVFLIVFEIMLTLYDMFVR